MIYALVEITWPSSSSGLRLIPRPIFGPPTPAQHAAFGPISMAQTSQTIRQEFMSRLTFNISAVVSLSFDHATRFFQDVMPNKDRTGPSVLLPAVQEWRLNIDMEMPKYSSKGIQDIDILPLLKLIAEAQGSKAADAPKFIVKFHNSVSRHFFYPDHLDCIFARRTASTEPQRRNLFRMVDQLHRPLSKDGGASGHCAEASHWQSDGYPEKKGTLGEKAWLYE